jgi:hypothetical protein
MIDPFHNGVLEQGGWHGLKKGKKNPSTLLISG